MNGKPTGNSPQILCALVFALATAIAGRTLNAVSPSLSGSGHVVCIDPGHPSETSRGAKGKAGLTEMHVNWVVAQALAQRLRDRGLRVVLTKSSEEEWVSNRRRAEIANAAHADLFLRLHCDSGAGSGTATYYPDRQGKAQGVIGPSREVMRWSAAAARRFHPVMMATLRPTFRDRGIRKESRSLVGGKQGALTGSIFSRVPALTVEMCLLNNRHDERLAGSEQGQTLLAEGLERGVLAALCPLQHGTIERRQPTPSEGAGK